MGWEERNGTSYYYRKVWRNGTCVSEYVGTGLLAQLAAAMDEQAAAEKERRRQAFDALVAREAQFDEEIDQLHEMVAIVVRTALRAVGYHQHKREWRLKRMSSQSGRKAVSKTKECRAETASRILAIANKKKPTPAQLDELRQALNDHPEIVDKLQSMPMQVQGRIIENMTKQPGIAEILQRQTEAIRRGLSYEGASFLERCMVDHIVTCWLHKQRIEHRYEEFFAKGGTIKEGDYWERKLNNADRRYLRAVESLAKVRMLLSRTEVYQINVAQNQQVINT